MSAATAIRPLIVPFEAPLPPELPARLPAPAPFRPLRVDAAPSSSTTVFLTIDTEDAYFTRPHLMTGDGIGRAFGVYGILDELDARDLRATFFVNVYEERRQPSGAVASVVRDIAVRGHEVGLHTHPVPGFDLYRRPLFRLPPQQQLDVLARGVSLIEDWTGEPVTSFRAGGYALNDDTFAALATLGIEIDSSCFYPSPNNRFERFTINAVRARAGVVEVPVTSVLRMRADGTLDSRKFDLDWLTGDQLMAALSGLVASPTAYAMFMMHSFSFIDKATRRPEEQRSADALFVSEEIFGRYVEIHGPKPAARLAFARFLDRLREQPAVHVRTLREESAKLRTTAQLRHSDVVTIVAA